MRHPLATLATLAALALLAPAGAQAARAPPTITYRGRTEGGSAVTAKVRAGRVTSFKASVYASCGRSDLLIAILYPPVGKRGASVRISDGAFRVSFRSDPTLDPTDDRRTITGRRGRGGRLSGRIVVRGLCSADETWSARRAR